MGLENLKTFEEDLHPTDKSFPFVLQSHSIGERVHIDLRVVVPDRSHLVGLTIVSGSDKTKEFLDGKSVKVLVDVKTRQPLPWLDMEGTIEPGEVGATDEYPGMVKILDKGKVRYGEKKPEDGYYEFFFDGDILKGRYVTRLIDTDDGKKLIFWKAEEREETDTTMNEELSINMEFAQYVEEDNILYFSGVGLEEGVWTDSHGLTAYFPRDIIHKYAKAFEGVRIRCQHNVGNVGTVIETELTDKGFRVSKGILTHKESVKGFLDGKFTGLSIGAVLLMDPVTRIVTDIKEITEISLVDRPACTTCLLDDEVIVVENVPDEVAMSADANLSYNEGETQMSDVEQIETETAIAEEVTVEASEAVEEIQDDVIEETVEAAEPEGEEVVETEEVEAEVEAGAEEVEDVVEETVEATEVEAESGETDVTAEMAALKNELDEKKVEIAELRAELSVIKAERDELVQEDYDRLYDAVMAADPNADKAYVDGLSRIELAAYKETVVRLKTPTVGAPRKAVKKDEASIEMAAAPEVKAPVEIEGRTATELFAQYLNTKQSI